MNGVRSTSAGLRADLLSSTTPYAKSDLEWCQPRRFTAFFVSSCCFCLLLRIQLGSTPEQLTSTTKSRGRGLLKQYLFFLLPLHVNGARRCDRHCSSGDCKKPPRNGGPLSLMQDRILGRRMYGCLPVRPPLRSRNSKKCLLKVRSPNICLVGSMRCTCRKCLACPQWPVAPCQTKPAFPCGLPCFFYIGA